MRTVKQGAVPWVEREKDYRREKYLAHKEEVRKVFPNIPYGTAKLFYTQWKKENKPKPKTTVSYYEKNKDKIRLQQKMKYRERVLNVQTGHKGTLDQQLTTIQGFNIRFLKLAGQGFNESEIRSMFTRNHACSIYDEKKRG